MALSAYTDGNRFLDEEKLRFDDLSTYSIDVTPADRLIRAALGDVFPDDVSTWDRADDPQPPGTVQPPDIIIDISAMLAAAYLYYRVYSEETTEVPAYAVQLEARATNLLMQVKAGTLAIEDSDGIAIISGTDFDSADFWPNDSTVDVYGEPLRLFTLEMKF